ncbi:MAG TPA: nuclear transport factor 2 family protein [Steroidobacteraceae bacterium]|nr:nuclear transport factor 2 family protein [Steroidobacteraceae bacterium]
MPPPTDEQEITALLTRYATGIDRRDWALFQTCFTDDVRTDYGSFGQWNSAAQITAFMQQAHAGMGHTLHRLSNFVISAQGQSAIARSYVDALLMSGAAGGDVHRGIGFYDDELVKTEQGWRIRFRRFTPVQIL